MMCREGRKEEYLREGVSEDQHWGFILFGVSVTAGSLLPSWEAGGKEVTSVGVGCGCGDDMTAGIWVSWDFWIFWEGRWWYLLVLFVGWRVKYMVQSECVVNG